MTTYTGKVFNRVALVNWNLMVCAPRAKCRHQSDDLLFSGPGLHCPRKFYNQVALGGQ